MLTLLLLGVLLGREAQAFYNPSAGRWPNRDPIGERGGGNLYGFADNRPTIEFDLDGRMSLRETPVQQDSSPTVGDYAGYNGLTWFAAFEPKAKVYKSVEGPCCWKVSLPGYADLVYWWVKNAPGEEPGTTALGHEMKHVEIHRATYKSFNASASRYVDKCFSKAKATCWRSVINGPLKDAWLAHNHTANLQVDAWYRGSEIPSAITTENARWNALAYEESYCASIE